MSKKEPFKKTPLALAIGTAFTVSLAQNSIANTQDNPFGISDLSSGYMIAEAKSSEGKCGSSKKTAEGQCGALTDDEKTLLKQSMIEIMEQMGKMSDEEKQAKMDEITPQQQAMIKMIKAENIAAKANKGKEGQCGEGKCGSQK